MKASHGNEEHHRNSAVFPVFVDDEITYTITMITAITTMTCRSARVKSTPETLFSSSDRSSLVIMKASVNSNNRNMETTGKISFFNKSTSNSNNTRNEKNETKPRKRLEQGDLTKKRCEYCLGTGKVPCYACTERDGSSKFDRVGFVGKRSGLPAFIANPFGFKRVDSKTGKVIKSDKNELVRCVTCVRVPGKVSCARCNGKGELLYRSAEWR